MSNVETAPGEVTCANTPAPEAGEILDPRAVPLGGPRAMTVSRTLPQRKRSLIGAWCFVDHFGPDDIGQTGGMQVPGHPHTGLQTVSWLFTGEIEHRDTTGAHARVRPGELNLMTAGSGIAHSEFSTPATNTLHGAQLWVALPGQHRFTEPGFEHYAPPETEYDGAVLRVFLGTLAGQTSPATTYSPLLGAEIVLPAGRQLRLPVTPEFEHGVLVDTGEATLNGSHATRGQLVYHPTGSTELQLETPATTSARVLLLGGEPLDEEIIMWWNFIGRSHDDIQQYREAWVAGRGYGDLSLTEGDPLPAPELPNTPLKPRRNAR